MWETDRSPHLAYPPQQGPLSYLSTFTLNGVTRCFLTPKSTFIKKKPHQQASFGWSCVQSATNLQQSLTARAYARLTHSVTHEGLPQISLDVLSVGVDLRRTAVRALPCVFRHAETGLYRYSFFYISMQKQAMQCSKQFPSTFP